MANIVGVLLSVLCFHSGYALVCLSCDGITHPPNCDLVSTCADGEVCFAKSEIAHDGMKVYFLGCKARNATDICGGSHTTSSCSECCATNLCNAQLCGEQGYPATRGPVCRRCESRLVNETCNIIDFCAQDEVCNTTHHGDIIIGKKKRRQHPSLEDARNPNICEMCCTSDLCNQDCGAHDCLDILKTVGHGIAKSGLYTVTTPLSHKKLDVYCDMDTDGGGWTVFQRRFNGQVDFYQNMSTYVSGFGSKDGEFWLGLQSIHELSTYCSESVLRVDLEKSDGTKGYETFQNFSLSPGPAYTLHIGKYSGTIGDISGLSYHNGENFYTFDHDNAYKCAVADHGGWWYRTCSNVNINGVYLHPPGSRSSMYGGHGMIYNPFDGTKSLKTSKMMVRRQQTSNC